MLRRTNLFALSLCAAALVVAFAPVPRAARAAGDDVPAWLKSAAASTAPAYDKQVKAVVLYKERNVSVETDGKVVTTTNYAVRILAREGRGEASAHAVYNTGSGKVRELKAGSCARAARSRSTGRTRRSTCRSPTTCTTRPAPASSPRARRPPCPAPSSATRR